MNRNAFQGGQTYERGGDGRNQASFNGGMYRGRTPAGANTFDRSGGSTGYRSGESHGSNWGGDNHGSNYGDNHQSNYGSNHGSSYGDNHGSNYGSNYGSNHGSGYYSGHGSYQNHQHYAMHGQVSHIDSYHGGYHVWLGGVPLPFFVPFALFQSDHFRIGMNVNLGGYYNPLGYYDYDNGYYGGGYPAGGYYGGGYSGSAYYRNGYSGGGVSSGGVLRGAVESVDERNGTFVIRNEATGSFVTVEMRDRNGEAIRPGDVVQLSGDWSRSGFFVAYGVNLDRSQIDVR